MAERGCANENQIQREVCRRESREREKVSESRERGLGFSLQDQTLVSLYIYFWLYLCLFLVISGCVSAYFCPPSLYIFVYFSGSLETKQRISRSGVGDKSL